MKQKFLFVRHAPAEERGRVLEDERALTEEGRQKLFQSILGLKKIVPEIDRIYTSPLTRCLQTAESLHKAFSDSHMKSYRELGFYASRAETRQFFDSIQETGVSVIVGHEPHLSELLAELLEVKNPSVLAFKKGGMACIEKENGEVRLLWLLPPKALRTLAQ